MEDYVTFILKTRGMRHVNRYTQCPSIRPNNVAEHSYYVSLYSILIYNYLCGEKMSMEHIGRISSYAIFHDMHEGISVEIPHNVKRKNKSESLNIEDMASSELYGGTFISKHIGKMNESVSDDNFDMEIVKIADMLDVLIYATEEFKMGNKFYLPIISEIKYSLKRVIGTFDKKHSTTESGRMGVFYNSLISMLKLNNVDESELDMESMTHIDKGFKV